MYLGELPEQRQLKGQCSEVVELHHGSICSERPQFQGECVRRNHCISAQVQERKGFSRADSQYRIGQSLARCSPYASSVLDASPRPEFILKRYIFSLMGVKLRTPFYT